MDRKLSEEENRSRSVSEEISWLGATTVLPNDWDEVVERLSASEGLLEEGERKKSTLEVLESYVPDPDDPLAHVTLKHIHRRLAKKMRPKRRRLHGNARRAIERRKMFERGSTDIWTNWEAIRRSAKLCHRWEIEFEDWMDVCEFIEAKWKIKDPWSDTRQWSFRRRSKAEKFTLDSLVIVHKKTKVKLFDPDEFKMWKLGYCEL